MKRDKTLLYLPDDYIAQLYKAGTPLIRIVRLMTMAGEDVKTATGRAQKILIKINEECAK